MHAMVTHPKGPVSTVDVNVMVKGTQLIIVRKAAAEGTAGLPKVCLTQTQRQIL